MLTRSFRDTNHRAGAAYAQFLRVAARRAAHARRANPDHRRRGTHRGANQVVVINVRRRPNAEKRIRASSGVLAHHPSWWGRSPSGFRPPGLLRQATREIENWSHFSANV